VPIQSPHPPDRSLTDRTAHTTHESVSTFNVRVDTNDAIVQVACFRRGSRLLRRPDSGRVSERRRRAPPSP
jgi:hypothetical protein